MASGGKKREREREEVERAEKAGGWQGETRGSRGLLACRYDLMLYLSPRFYLHPSFNFHGVFTPTVFNLFAASSSPGESLERKKRGGKERGGEQMPQPRSAEY